MYLKAFIPSMTHEIDTNIGQLLIFFSYLPDFGSQNFLIKKPKWFSHFGSLFLFSLIPN
jgi:hypothetical protein